MVKYIYSILLNLEDLPPPTSEKKLLMSGVEKSDLNKKIGRASCRERV